LGNYFPGPTIFDAELLLAALLLAEATVALIVDPADLALANNSALLSRGTTFAGFRSDCALTMEYNKTPPIPTADPIPACIDTGFRKTMTLATMMNTRFMVFPTAKVTGWTLLSA
jgi:hypothetical protein